ncbi:hypothetical protein RUM43_014207, partial [Polyplax serrata]
EETSDAQATRIVGLKSCRKAERFRIGLPPKPMGDEGGDAFEPDIPRLSVYYRKNTSYSLQA